jgi:molybdopterin converting factor small subunit
VTVNIPAPLRQFSGGHARIEIAALPGTLGDVLKALWTQCPGLRDRIVTEQGEIRQHVNVFVGNEKGDLATPVKDGAEITIVAAITGG